MRASATSPSARSTAGRSCVSAPGSAVQRLSRCCRRPPRRLRQQAGDDSLSSGRHVLVRGRVRSAGSRLARPDVRHERLRRRRRRRHRTRRGLRHDRRGQLLHGFRSDRPELLRRPGVELREQPLGRCDLRDRLGHRQRTRVPWFTSKPTRARVLRTSIRKRLSSRISTRIRFRARARRAFRTFGRSTPAT